jgi:hypothetical protein
MKIQKKYVRMYFFSELLRKRLCRRPKIEVEGKAIPLQALTGPEGSRRLRLPDCKTIGTLRW